MRDRKSLIEQRITQPTPAYHVNRVWDYDTAEMNQLDADEAKREKRARLIELRDALVACGCVVLLVAGTVALLLFVGPALLK